MNTSKLTRFTLLAAGVMMLHTACDTVNPEAVELTDQDIEMAAEIIAQSLSDDGSGLISGLYDAVSEVQPGGIRYGDQRHEKGIMTGDHRHGRGSESEYHASYDPETGEHIIAFRRSFTGEHMSQTLSVLSKYIYTDADGNFLEWPRRQQDLIETIDFKGFRSGTYSGPIRTASFNRIDTLYLTGMSSASPVLMLDGNHHSDGEMTVRNRRDGVDMDRTYSLEYHFVDVAVDKDIVRESGSLDEGVSGYINYRLHMIHTKNGETRDRNVSGTIELNGDGTALLRFENVQRFFLIALRDGQVTRSDSDSAR